MQVLMNCDSVKYYDLARQQVTRKTGHQEKADYTGNFGVENERSLGRIGKQEKNSIPYFIKLVLSPATRERVCLMSLSNF